MYRVTFRILETWDEHFYETRNVRLPLEPEWFRTSGRNTAEGISHKCGEDPEFPRNKNRLGSLGNAKTFTTEDTEFHRGTSQRTSSVFFLGGTR